MSMPRGRVLLHPPKTHVEHAHPKKHEPKAKPKKLKSQRLVARQTPPAEAKPESVFSMFARVFAALSF